MLLYCHGKNNSLIFKCSKLFRQNKIHNRKILYFFFQKTKIIIIILNIFRDFRKRKKYRQYNREDHEYVGFEN